MSEWISVGDRLPKSGKRVIFTWLNDYTPAKRRTSAGFYAGLHDVSAENWDDNECAEYSEEKDEYFCPQGWHEEMWEADYFYPVSGVTHWMPLPEPPTKPLGSDITEDKGE